MTAVRSGSSGISRSAYSSQQPVTLVNLTSADNTNFSHNSGRRMAVIAVLKRLQWLAVDSHALTLNGGLMEVKLEDSI